MLKNRTVPFLFLPFLLFLTLMPSILCAQSGSIVSDGYIVSDFEGWDGETVFEMSDGTYWIQAAYSYLYHYAYNPKAIVIQRGSNYYLKVEGIREILPVLPIDKLIKSRIDGNFEGFKGDTIYKLMNGTVWQQIDGRYKYKYAYSPRVIVYKIGSRWKMTVKGITVSVIQLRSQ